MATVASDVADPQREVSLERVFGRGFGTIRANPVATLGIAFLFGAVPTLVVNYYVQSVGLETMIRIGFWGTLAGMLAGLALWLIIAAVTQGALVRATVGHSEGHEASFGESVAAGLTVIIPLVLLTLLLAVAVILGLVLLIVPGVMLYCMWAVATPALVAERIGPLAALARSRHLTRGARWKIFGLTLLVLIVSWVLSGTASAISFQLLGGMNGFMRPGMFPRMPFSYYLVQTLVNTVCTCVWSVLVSALYLELRDWKDGPRSEHLAEVFR